MSCPRMASINLQNIKNPNKFLATRVACDSWNCDDCRARRRKLLFGHFYGELRKWTEIHVRTIHDENLKWYRRRCYKLKASFVWFRVSHDQVVIFTSKQIVWDMEAVDPYADLAQRLQGVIDRLAFIQVGEMRVVEHRPDPRGGCFPWIHAEVPTGKTRTRNVFGCSKPIAIANRNHGYRPRGSTKAGAEWCKVSFRTPKDYLAFRQHIHSHGATTSATSYSDRRIAFAYEFPDTLEGLAQYRAFRKSMVKVINMQPCIPTATINRDNCKREDIFCNHCGEQLSVWDLCHL